MAIQKVEMHFNHGFHGELIAPKATVAIGSKKDELAPYDMLLGALGSCLYATFIEIAVKKRIHFDAAHISVEGEKRETIPTTLKWVKVKLSITNAEKESGLVQAAELAAKYCSIYQTLSHVAEMSWEIEFITI